MPFVMVSGVGRGMGVLDGGGDHRREDTVLEVNVEYPVITNGDSDALFPNNLRRTCCYYYYYYYYYY